MTRSRSFKRRVRARMAKTGERYVAARRVLIEQATPRDAHAWISPPEQSQEAVLRGTGRGWDEWREQIDAWPGHEDGRAAVTRWLQDEHGLGGWWAMAVTLGWERITGRRLPHQRPDGTFSVTKSATITTDVVALREMLLDDTDRRDLFPGVEVELRSRPSSKTIRLGMMGGTVELVLEPKTAGRATVHVEHSRLPSPDHVEHWRAFWADWLASVDEAAR